MNKKYIMCLGFMWILFSTCVMAAAPTNVVVNFDSTSVDTNLMVGDSGILNLVIENTGGQLADNVYVSLPSNAIIHIDKRFYLGQIAAGESKTTPVSIIVENTAKTGLTGIQVQISYNGYDSDGEFYYNKVVTMEIPVRIYGNPLFQLTPSKTTYYKDNTEELRLEGLSKSSVKDLEATLSSSCATVIGSSRSFAGDINANQIFNLSYLIMPSQSGACIVTARLSYTDESGSKIYDNVSIGLNVEDASVDFKIINVSYTPTGPGEQTDLTIYLKNVGSADASDVNVNLDLSSPFTPVGTSEKYLTKIQSGEEVMVDFKLAIGWDASTTAYSIPVELSYKVGGTTYNVTKNIGIDASGRVILEVIQVQSTGSSVRIDVANIGTRTADGVKATLIISAQSGDQQAFNRTRPTGENTSLFSRNTTQRPGNMSQIGEQQRLVSYKSDIKPSKQTTFTFSTSASGMATLELEYTGLNNQRVTQTERLTLSGSGSNGPTGFRNAGSTSGISTTTILVVIAVIAIIAFLVYKRVKSKNKN